jgi:hypothetical protein
MLFKRALIVTAFALAGAPALAQTVPPAIQPALAPAAKPATTLPGRLSGLARSMPTRPTPTPG